MKRFVPVDQLSIAAIKENPVWQYVNSGGASGILVRPMKRVPVNSLKGRIVGTRVRLANGELIWALIGNVDESNPLLTEHFITLSLEHRDRWIRLARYHDYDSSEHGPEALARELGLDVDDVFPIAYDVRELARGDERSLAGKILKEPSVKLSRAEIIALAVP